MTSEKLNELITREKNSLKKLYEKRAEIDAKIKKGETKLQEYEMMSNSQQFGALTSVISKNGLSVDDLLAAIQNGDLLTLQEKLEAAQNAPVEETATDVNNFEGTGES